MCKRFKRKINISIIGNCFFLQSLFQLQAFVISRWHCSITSEASQTDADHDAAVVPSVHTGCRCWIERLHDSARLTFTSPPPLSLCQVCTGLQHHTCWGWNMHVWGRLSSDPTPPHLHWCHFSIFLDSGVAAGGVVAPSSASLHHLPLQHPSPLAFIFLSHLGSPPF